MPRPLGRREGWLSQSVLLVLPDDPENLRLSISASRQILSELAAGSNASVKAGWAIAGGLLLASDPQARPRRRGAEVSLRLDRLPVQIRAQVSDPARIDEASLTTLIEKALVLGMSDDPDAQRKALRFFAAQFLVTGFPPFRIAVNYVDLVRLRVGLEKHPLQFVLQLVLMGTDPLLRFAPPQPRGPRTQTASRASLVGFLACLAEELILRGGPISEVMGAAALAAGYRQGKELPKLEFIQFLVERALSKTFGSSLGLNPPDHADFARTYLYPYHGRLGDLPKRALEIPGFCERLFGLT
jgi:hypothetical protein